MRVRLANSECEVRLAASTAVELLVELYVGMGRWFFGRHPDVPRPEIPDQLRRAAEYCFSGHIALGMNVVPYAYERGWQDVEALASGIAEMPTVELAQELLRAPDASAEDGRHHARSVAEVIAGNRPPDEIVRLLGAEGLEEAAVSWVLADPSTATQQFAEIVAHKAGQFRPREKALRARLEQAMARARTTLAAKDLPEAIEQLTGGWTLRNAASFSEIALLPSIAIRPYVSTRIAEPERAWIVFPASEELPAPEGDLAEAVRALAHPQRLAMLRHLSRHPATGQELAEMTGLTEPTVHHHTAFLRTVGLLVSERDAARLYHTADKDRFEQLLEELRRFVLE